MNEVETLTLEDESNNNKKVKRKLKLWVKLLIFIIVIILLVIITYSYLLTPVKTKSEVIEFTVESGSSVYNVGEKLSKQGIIRSSFAYKIYVKLNNINEYKAGIYKLDKSYNTKDIVSILTGNMYKEKGAYITFKEGKTIRSVAKVIAKNTDITTSDFYSALEDNEYIDSLIDKYWFLTDDIKNKDIYYPLEGYLFPDTYQFKENVTAREIIEDMLEQSDKIFSKYKSLIDKSSYSIHELVTLASIVEAEGIYDNDRKEIAGVFYNRLKAGMSLGSDVTTYYALKVDLGERDLTSAEYNTINPYNTRTSNMAGKLPIGPICNFGETSLEAVLNPTNSDYYYFVADKSGKTHFTRTYEEHQKIITELKAAGNWIEW